MENTNTIYHKKWKVLGLLVIFYLYLPSVLFAHCNKQPDGVDSIVTKRFSIYYPISKTSIDETYMSNKTQLSQMKKFLTTSRIDSIVIHSYASPEGPYLLNLHLTKHRGISARDYLLEHFRKVRPDELPDSLIRLNPTAENWEGLRKEVLSNYSRKDLDKVLEIIDRQDMDAEQKKQALRSLDNGHSWEYLLKHCMPQLRHATWTFVCAESMPRTEMLPPLQATNRIQAPTLPVLSLLPERPLAALSPKEDTRTILAVKTNLLYDLASLLNVSVEVPFHVRDQQFSVVAQHQFPWWLSKDNRHCIRFLSTGLEGRWWFKPMFREATEKRLKRDALMGHFVGVYALSGKWDFQWERKGCYQGEFWSVGVDYGYSMPIGKRCNLEFTIALGYASIPYRHYIPSEDWETLYRDYDDTGVWHYIGPTRAEVSLVVPLFKKIKKGGKR